MSYILEALKKADAERQRERGGVPDLLTQPLPGYATARPRNAGVPLAWVVAGISTALALATAAWLWPGRGAQEVRPVVAVAPTAAPSPAPSPTPSPAPPPASTTAAPAVAAPAAAVVPPPVSAPSPATSSVPTTTPGARPQAGPPAVRASAPARARPKPAASTPSGPPSAAPSIAQSAANPASAAPITTAAPPPGAAVAPVAPSAPPAAAAPAPRIPALVDLGEDFKRQLPPLKPGGSVYSDNPAQRMVVFDRQVYREGDRVSADLLVEQIRPNGVVLVWRGTRFLMPL